MKTAAIMNFVRQIDQRYDNCDFMLEKTYEELMLVNELQVKNTFLLQYDTVCNPKYVDMFQKHATENTELGIWYEIVRPLSENCGIPYHSKYGWDWDWNIVPGFSMAYTPLEREKMVDEAMRKFKEAFGYYPKTFASWVIDTHTANCSIFTHPLSAIVTVEDNGHIVIEGMETDYAYDVSPEKYGGPFMNAYGICEPRISSAEFSLCIK